MRLEIEDSSKHNEEIAAKWTVVTALEVPQELGRKIANQRKVGSFCLSQSPHYSKHNICGMLSESLAGNNLVISNLSTIIRSAKFRFVVCCGFLIIICVQEILIISTPGNS